MENVNELLKEILTTLKDTKAFVLEQAPDLVKQIIAYEIASSWFWFGICFVFIVACVLVLIWSFKKCREELKKGVNGEEHIYVPMFFFSAFFGVLFLAGLLCNSASLVKVYSAPKLVLIEKVGDLLR